MATHKPPKTKLPQIALNAPVIHSLATIAERTPQTPYTLDRSRRYRTLAAAQPRLPYIIDETTSKYAHLHRTTDKKSILRILLSVCDAFTEDDPVLRQRLQDLAFEEVCSLLQIDSCYVEEIKKQLKRLCKDKCSCFGI